MLEMLEKLIFSQGLCTSVHANDYENVLRIQLILKCFIVGIEMERASRTQDDWARIDSLPMNFADYRFRAIIEGMSSQEWIDRTERKLENYSIKY